MKDKNLLLGSHECTNLTSFENQCLHTPTQTESLNLIAAGNDIKDISLSTTSECEVTPLVSFRFFPKAHYHKDR